MFSWVLCLRSGGNPRNGIGRLRLTWRRRGLGLPSQGPGPSVGNPKRVLAPQRLGPPVPFLTHFFFGWEGSPTKIDHRRKGYPYSCLAQIHSAQGVEPPGTCDTPWCVGRPPSCGLLHSAPLFVCGAPLVASLLCPLCCWRAVSPPPFWWCRPFPWLGLFVDGYFALVLACGLLWWGSAACAHPCVRDGPCSSAPSSPCMVAI